MITIYKNNKRIITLNSFQSFIRYVGKQSIINFVDEGYTIRNTDI